MPRYVYRQDNATGNVNAVLISARVPYEGTPVEATTDFQQTVLNAYRDIEADGKLKGGYSKNIIKQVHETALERDRHHKS